MSTAVVVGGGPNGLAAAVALAKEGVQVTVLEAAEEIGGGARSSEAIVPGLLHDHCSAFHPMAVGSTFLNSLGLDRYGLQWRWPEIDCVHPLDGGDAGVLWRSLDDTAAGLGSDGPRWRRAFGRPAATFDALAEDIMGPLLRVPKHPLILARFGAPTVLPASTLARYFRTERGRALFGGVAAHTFRPLHYPMTSAIGLGIITAGHRYGWPVAAGGSQSITNALVSLLGDLGGKIETGMRIDSASQLPQADVTMFDLAPTAIAGILGDRLPARVARALRRFRYGPGAFKVDYAVEGGVPWTNDAARRAGTVHLGGDYAEVAGDRARDPRRADARAAVRACRSAVPRGPWPLRRRHASACGRMRMSRTAIRVTPLRRSPPRSSGSPPGSATESSGKRCDRPPRWPCTTPTT